MAVLVNQLGLAPSALRQLPSEADPHRDQRQLYYIDGTHRMQAVQFINDSANAEALVVAAEAKLQWNRVDLIPTIRVMALDPNNPADRLIMRSCGRR